MCATVAAGAQATPVTSPSPSNPSDDSSTLANRAASASSRVHDSRLTHNEDFGPRWKLSLVEQILLDDDGLTYVNRSGARHRFKDGGRGFEPASPTPRHAQTRILIHGDHATLHDTDGTLRTFERVTKGAGRFRIARVQSRQRTVAFAYVRGLLSAVTDGDRVLFSIRRNRAGRIVSVSDLHGRSVHYSYTAAGQLKDVIDLAGHLWWHEYDDAGRMTAAYGANRKPYLYIGYDAAGRVVESRSGRRYAFSYALGKTVVTEGTGQRHVFHQNTAGATVTFESSSGMRWQIALDDRNRVTRLLQPDAALEYTYDYGREGRIAERWRKADATNRTVFAYDDAGRFESAIFSAWRVDATYRANQMRLVGEDWDMEVVFTSDGRIASVLQDGVATLAEYGGDGSLKALRRGDRSVRFARDALGRIVEVVHANGDRNRYAYDALGNRRLTQYGTGASVRYSHDPAGNIVTVAVTEKNGTTLRQAVEVGDMNRVESIAYDRAHTLRVAYDSVGRPVRFDNGKTVVTASYAGNGLLEELTSSNGGHWRNKVDIRSRGDRRQEQLLRVLSGDTVGASHPDYGVLEFTEFFFEPMPRSSLELGVPDLEATDALLAVADDLFGDGPDGPIPEDDVAALLAFEKPSNPVFQPPEYRSTNCCVGCTSSGLCEVCGGINTPGLCQCAPLEYGPGGGGGGGGSCSPPSQFSSKGRGPAVAAQCPVVPERIEPPGDCSEGLHQQLQVEVNSACKHGRVRNAC